MADGLIDIQRTSYAIGLDLSQNFVREDVPIDEGALVAGIRDGLHGYADLSDEELAQALQSLSRYLAERSSQANAAEAEAAAVESQVFLEQNAQRPGVTTLDSGLQFQVITVGTGASPGPNDRVVAHYRGALWNGTEFDSSYTRGTPLEFALSQVIPGWTEGLQLMREGGTYKLFIPSNLGYGASGAGGTIPANAALVFDIELVEVVSEPVNLPPEQTVSP